MDIVNPRAVRAFVVLAEELHFGRAAQRLGVSQSTVSEQLRTLEDALGVVLFERHSRGVHLSESGAHLVEPARELLAGHERFHTLARTVAFDEHGLTVGAIAGAMPMVTALTEAAGRAGIPITIRILTLAEGLRAVASGEVTTMLAALLDEVPTPGLSQIVLASSEVVAVISLSHDLASLEQVPRSALVGRRTLVPAGLLPAVQRLLGSPPHGPDLREIPSLPHSAGELLADRSVGLSLHWFSQWWRGFGLVERPLEPAIVGRVGLIHRTTLSEATVERIQRLASESLPLMPNSSST